MIRSADCGEGDWTMPGYFSQDGGKAMVSLRGGEPRPATLATPQVRAAVAMAMGSPDFYRGLQYGPDEGTQSLIAYLLEKLSREQAIATGHANIMLVAGSTHAVDMLARIYAKPGDVVLVEAPTY